MLHHYRVKTLIAFGLFFFVFLSKSHWAQVSSVDPQAPLRPQLTSQDYARAEKFLFWNIVSLVSAGVPERPHMIFNDQVEPNWIDKSDAFWYRSDSPNGKQFIYVDPARALKRRLFDHARLAVALSRASGKHYDANALPFVTLKMTDEERAIEFSVGQDLWSCKITTYECSKLAGERPSPAEVRSPDGRWTAFTKQHNLYVRSLATGQEIQLTKDGEEYNDYASLPDSRSTAVSDRISGVPLPAQVVWAPDSTKLVTYRLDQRKVKQLYLVQSVPPKGFRPILYSFRYPMPGDPDVALAHLMVFDLQRRNEVVLDYPPQIVDYVSPTQMHWVWWGKHSAHVYFIEKDRGEKTLKLNIADASIGKTRTIIQEHSPTFLEPSLLLGTPPLVRDINGGAEILWFSQRDGWGHLYLYDGKTGALKDQVTSGSWNVRRLLHIDEANRWVYFSANGREPGDPYLRHVYRIKLDGTDLQLLTPEDADHLNTPLFVMDPPPAFSPTGHYFVDTYSRADTPPVTVLRSCEGKLILTLERADVSALEASGWKPPERFHTKAADGVTDIYGLIYRPFSFDPSKKYPVIDSIYPGPQAIRTIKTFGPDFGNAPALAELGFIVVTVDGRGTPLRSKAFHDYVFGHMGTAGGLEDHIAALRALAAKYPAMDLTRVGVYGHSAGGFASARAILMYPDFYKVAVASAGAYDQRIYVANWGEKYEGLVQDDNYREQATPLLAGNLKGKLLLAYGDMDDNVSPASTLQLANALINANKDFDLLVLPNRNHLSDFDPYFIRREWDYMVKNLLGAEPPAGYEIADPLRPVSK